VICPRNNQQFLVIARQLFIDSLTEIAGVRLFSVYQQHGRANLAAVLQDSRDISLLYFLLLALAAVIVALRITTLQKA